MNPPQPIEASRQVGTSVLCWLAAVLPVLKSSFSTTAREGRRATGRVEKLFQLPSALGMNPPQPVLASGPVSTAVLGWLAALVPLLKDLLLEPCIELVSADMYRDRFCVSHVILPSIGPLTMFHGSLVTRIPFSDPDSLG